MDSFARLCILSKVTYGAFSFELDIFRHPCSPSSHDGGGTSSSLCLTHIFEDYLDTNDEPSCIPFEVVLVFTLLPLMGE